MNKYLWAASAIALAASTPVLAQQGNKGGGHGQGGSHGQGGNHGPAMKAERGGGPKADRGPAQAKQDRGPSMKIRQAERGNSGKGVDRPKGKDMKDVRAASVDHRGPARSMEARGNDDGVFVRRSFDSPFLGRAQASLGCPPGLEKKDNGCLPPGQAKKLLGAALPTGFRDAMIPYAYRNWYRDNDEYLYRMGDGFIYRVDRGDNLVSGLIPLFGSGYYTMGDPWPQPYNFYNVPTQYRDYWADSPDYYYRYGDGAIYRVDAKSQLVSGIVALLAGDLGVGARLPVGYDTYNVPLAYRDRYYDTASDWYRYNDGYIYRVDPTTRLITAVINAIV